LYALYAYNQTLGKMAPPINTQLIQQEGRIALAMQALKQGHFTSVRDAAKSFDVANSTLLRRVKGRPMQYNRRSPNCKLTATEETTLVQWILSIDERGLAPRPDSVRQMVNLLIVKRSNSTSNPNPKSLVGQRWVINFVRRHQALHT
jgi:hypothetical protein